MKKVSLLLILVLVLGVFAGCAQQAAEEPAAELQKIVVGATPSPHAEILNAIKEDMAAAGYELVVQEFTDYVLPNTALENKELDANFFQHVPYLDDFNKQNGTNIVSLAPVHYEPLGLYPGKTAALADIKDGATIAVPNDTTNEARALLLLESVGLIKVDPNAGLTATKNDITENPKNLVIQELEAAQVARVLPDVDMAVINGNYAIQAGLNAATDAVAKEEKESLAATTFANILAIRAGDEGREDLAALVSALQSDKVKAFIEEKYQGAVVPMF